MQHADWIRRTGPLASLALGLAVAGCGGDISGVGDDVAKTVISGNASDKSVVEGINPDTFRREVPCPPLEVEPGHYLLMIHDRGKDDDPKALRYQANIENWARRCVRDGGDGVLMTVGVSGRVTPGPAWQGGEVMLPIRLSIVNTAPDGPKPVVRQLSVPVTLGAGSPAEQWALVEENVAIPQTASTKVQIALDEKGKRRQ